MQFKLRDFLIEQNINIKLFVDLADICKHPGSLLKTLKSVRQSEYRDNDRIIFYTSQLISDDLIRHLYYTCNHLDIGNFFILICSSEHENEKIIQQGCKEYSFDSTAFNFLFFNIEHTQTLLNNFKLPESICSIPWNNVEILPNGDLTPCCRTQNIVLGNISEISINDAFHSQTAKNFRQQFLDQKRPVECKFCWDFEDKGLTSIRLYNQQRLNDDFLLETINKPIIKSLDLKFNNTCNFKCRICNSTASSMHAQEEYKFFNIPIAPQVKWEESLHFADSINEVIDSINNIDLYGGEPFLIKKFTGILKLLVDKNKAKNIRLHYNSNGSVWPEEFLPYWPEFKEIDIHFSIDNIGKKFELERGGLWSDVESNILRLKNYGFKNLKISIMPTISIMNIYYLDELYAWATTNNFPIFINHVVGSGVELSELTESAKNLIINKLKDHPWSEIQKIVADIKIQKPSTGEKFRKTMKKFDQIRKESFATTHPEIAAAMGYVDNQ